MLIKNAVAPSIYARLSPVGDYCGFWKQSEVPTRGRGWFAAFFFPACALVLGATMRLSAVNVAIIFADASQ